MESHTGDDARLIAQTTLICQLRIQLADMTESQLSLTEMHSILVSQVHNLEHEVAERTAECYRLREENEGFEILLRERTLDGRVYDADVFGSQSDDESSSDGEDRGAITKTADKPIGERDSDSGANGRGVRAAEGDKSNSRRRRKGANLAEELENSPARAASPSSSSAPQEDSESADGKGNPDRAVATDNPTVICKSRSRPDFRLV